ncbi:MAG: hypothetical protein QOJ42_458 [Acidobacteriaceae bacterium]|nr:hypothetical protein [Acidobacteriaceae bacterium]MDX6464636.1 hypothetical protein [Acidobacteriaceae bacterium]
MILPEPRIPLCLLAEFLGRIRQFKEASRLQLFGPRNHQVPRIGNKVPQLAGSESPKNPGPGMSVEQLPVRHRNEAVHWHRPL